MNAETRTGGERMTVRCDWAGCTRHDTTTVDGWDFCPDHLAEHRDLVNDPTPADRQREARDARRQQLHDEVRTLHAAGLKDREIGERLSHSGSYIASLRKTLGLKPQHRVQRQQWRLHVLRQPDDAARVDEAVRLRNVGVSLSAISVLVDAAPSAVCEWLQAAASAPARRQEAS